MSRRLPEFTATGGFTEQQVVSTASQGQSLTALGQRVASIGQKIFREGAIKRAQDLGEVAGLQENLRPKPAFTDAQRAFNKTALEAHKGIIATDLTRNAEQIRHEVWAAEISRPNPSAKHALNSFTTRWAAYMQTTMENVPAGNKAFAFNYGNNQGARHQMFFQNQEIAQATRMTKMNHAATDAAFSTAIQNQAHVIPYKTKDPVLLNSMLNAFHKLGSDRLELNKNALSVGIISPGEAENTRKETLQQMRDLPIVGNYRLALQQGEGPKFIQRLNAKNFPDAKPLWSMIATETARFKQSQIVSTAQGEVLGQQVIKVANDKGILNSVDLAKAQSMLSKKAGEKVELKARNGVNNFNATKSLLELSPVARTRLINEELTKAKAAKDTVSIANLETIQTNLIDANKKLHTDPVKFFNDNPQIKMALAANAINIPLDANQATTMNKTGAMPSLTNTDDVQTLAQAAQGFTADQTRYLTKGEAGLLGSQINQAKTQEERQTILNELRTKHKGRVQQILHNLKQDGFIESGAGFLMQIPANFPYPQDVNAAFSQPEKVFIDANGKANEAKLQAAKKTLLTDPPSPLGTLFKDAVIGLSEAVSGVTVGFIPEINTSVYNNWQNLMASMAPTGDNQAFKNTVADGVVRLGRVFMVNHSMSATDALKRGMSSLADSFDFVTLGGQVIRYPKSQNISETHLRLYANERQKQDIRLKDGFAFDTAQGTARVIKGSDREIAFRTLVNSGHWANTPDGLGMHWILSTGAVMVDAFGHDNRFTWEDAKQSREIPVWRVISNNAVKNALTPFPAFMNTPFRNAFKGG